MLTVKEHERSYIKNYIELVIISPDDNSWRSSSITFEAILPIALLEEFFPTVLVEEIVSYVEIEFDVECRMSKNYFAMCTDNDEIIDFDINYECVYKCMSNTRNTLCEHFVPRITIENVGVFDISLITNSLQELSESKNSTYVIDENLRRWNSYSAPFSSTVQNLLDHLKIYGTDKLVYTFQVILWFCDVINSCFRK